MSKYPTDLDLNEGKDVHLDATNDLALTSGVAQLQQSVGIDVMDELQDFIAGRLTGKNIGQLEERIAAGLNNNPQVDAVRSVSLDTFDRQNNTVEITVHVVEDENFTLEVEP
jgi:hypothetical protein